MPSSPVELQLDLPLGSAAGTTAGCQYLLDLPVEPVSYRLRRSASREVRVMLREGCLDVIAPRGVRLKTIEDAVRKRAARAAAPAAADAAFPGRWCAGSRFTLWGRDTEVRLERGLKAPRLEASCLALALPPRAAATQVRDAALAWLQECLRNWVQAALPPACAALGVGVPQWSLSFRSRELVEVLRDGRLRINLRLVAQAPSVAAILLENALRTLRGGGATASLWDGGAEAGP